MRISVIALLLFGSWALIHSCRTAAITSEQNYYSEEFKLTGTLKSLYDSVEAPHLIFDSVKFNSRLPMLLMGTNKMKWSGGDSYCVNHLTIDSLGAVHSARFDSPADISAEMDQLMRQILLELNRWEPAYLKADPNIKVSYRVQMVIDLRKNDLSFEIFGAERKYFIQKTFRRPIK